MSRSEALDGRQVVPITGQTGSSSNLITPVISLEFDVLVADLRYAAAVVARPA